MEVHRLNLILNLKGFEDEAFRRKTRQSEVEGVVLSMD